MKFVFAVLCILICYSIHANAAEESMEFGRFGKLAVYHPTPHPGRVVVLVSGDAGWTQNLAETAQDLQAQDTLVVGVDGGHYLKKLNASGARCTTPAVDLDSLSKFVQKKLGYEKYVLPVLVGYSSGAALVYAALVQSPPTTFAGAISLGFCPELAVTRPLCKMNGLESERMTRKPGYSFLPAKKLPDPWMVLQGDMGQTCTQGTITTYVKSIPGAELVELPKADQTKNWTPQLREALVHLTQPRKPAPGEPVEAHAEDIKDLPMEEVASGGSKSPYFAVVISGDGGWAGIDREIGAALSRSGVPVAGLNSLKYFWTKRTPEGAAADLARIFKHYIAQWGRDKVIIIGYSFGAEVLPFLLTRLPPELASKVNEIVLLTPGRNADFEFHFTSWINVSSKDSRPVLPEIEKLKNPNLLCIYGDEEDDSLCTTLNPKLSKSLEMKGGHHLGGNYDAIAAEILKNARP